MKFEFDPRRIVRVALGIGDTIHVTLSPNECPGGTPTRGVTDKGPYTLVIEKGAAHLSEQSPAPTCIAPRVIATAQEWGPGPVGCRGICELCHHGVWGTNAGPEAAITDSGWMRVDTL